MSLVPHLCTFVPAYLLVHPLKKSFSFLNKCLICLWSILRVTGEKKKNQRAMLPLWDFMFSLNRAKTSPILFLLKVVKGIFSLLLMNHHLGLHGSTEKELFFDLGRNGYQTNISLTCSLLEGRGGFLHSDLILILPFLPPCRPLHTLPK